MDFGFETPLLKWRRQKEEQDWGRKLELCLRLLLGLDVATSVRRLDGPLECKGDICSGGLPWKSVDVDGS